MQEHIHRIIRFLSALPLEREDWLLIESKKGLNIPIPDFHRARHGKLSERQKGLPSVEQERRLIGPRLLLFSVVFTVIFCPLWLYTTIFNLPFGRWRLMTLSEKMVSLFSIHGHLNPAILFGAYYPLYIAILAVRIMLTRRRSHQAHYRIPRRDGMPNGLDNITPELIKEYLALGDSCYIVDALDRYSVRYRQGSKTLSLMCDESMGGEREMTVHICTHQPVWSDLAGEPIEQQQWSLVLKRLRQAVKFAGYIPRFVDASPIPVRI